MTIGGVTNGGDALIRVVVEGRGGAVREAEAVLDTGFNGFLALPRREIEALGLEFRNEVNLGLASGETRSMPTYFGTVSWNDVSRAAVVVEAGETLAGMALLWGRVLRIECWDGGTVKVEDV